jgi:hypothetical protein
MLIIRKEQMKAFENDALRRFEGEMLLHSKEFTPRLCKVLGDEQLRVAVRQAMERADSYGFTNRGPIRLYIELMFLYGSDFDTDPQYPALREGLNAPDDQMLRAEWIYQGILDYQKKVSGINAVNVRKALTALSALAEKNLVTFSPNNFLAEMLREITHAFPQKVAYIGEEALTTLVHAGSAEARKYGFSTDRGKTLMVVLMFAFGHGCSDDPLYPWISRTLKDKRIVDSAARANRLEKKAITWLDHVLAGPWKGEQA